MRQRQPANPTDPGDAADLSIMGYPKTAFTEVPAALPKVTFAQDRKEINSFLTIDPDSHRIG
ncbi:hypothetical protein [Mesorhizobium sp. CAU 1741]|uniref:hypothetical protein n=1 Tax=Mesorhizobium sp. CAU 1741 TaxID=3140366 RepID=UPI00325AC93C